MKLRLLPKSHPWQMTDAGRQMRIYFGDPVTGTDDTKKPRKLQGFSIKQVQTTG